MICEISLCMRTLSSTLILTTLCLLLWGCGASQNSNITSPGFPNNPGACLPGQVLTANGQCLDQFGCNSGFGFDGTACVPGTPVDPNTFYKAPFQATYGSTLSINNRHRFEDFLEKVGGVCNFSNFFSFSLFGPDPYDCRTYSSRGFVYLQLFSSGTPGSPMQAYVTIGAGVNSPNDGLYGGYGYQTIPLNMTSEPINNGEGFILRSSGGYFGGYVAGLHSSVSIRVEDGDPTRDNQFQVIISHNGAVFAKAFVARQ